VKVEIAAVLSPGLLKPSIIVFLTATSPPSERYGWVLSVSKDPFSRALAREPTNIPATFPERQEDLRAHLAR